MPRIQWNAAGERFFEAGVSHGVLYIDALVAESEASVMTTQDGDELTTEDGLLLETGGEELGAGGVPWNGLVSVAENPEAGQVTPYFIDGIKYLNHVSLEEFKATIEAFTYPEEFSWCDGTHHVGNGLYVTQQQKRSFGLTYRTGVGNDTEGINHGYKIHIVYNATASPTERANTTISDQPEPFNFSWEITTKAPDFKGFKPTAHFVIDSRKTPERLIRAIEDILYGSPTSMPRLPHVDELLFMFDEFELMIYDAGYLVEQYFAFIDAGEIPEPYSETLDAGGP